MVPEDDGGGASGAVDDGSGALLPDVDNAQRDDVVPEDDGGGASGAVDEGTEGRLPDVDNAQRDDVVEEEEEGATGRAANAPAPTGLTVTSDTDDSVSLSWNTVTDAGAYKVEYRMCYYNPDPQYCFWDIVDHKELRIREGGGAGRRTTARPDCISTNEVAYYSMVDVDLVGTWDGPYKWFSPVVEVPCYPAPKT